jgi:stress response protein YsnF
MGKTVIGIFENSSNAYEAVEKLTNSGFSTNEIDISENENYDRPTTDDTYQEEDGISRFFNNLFGNDEQSRYYSEVTRRSSCLVTVHAQSDEEAHRAASILDDYGAVDVDDRAAEYGFNIEHHDKNRGTDSNETRSIPIIEEEMHVGKREVETGKVTIRSRIINKPVEETLRLRRVSVSVERKPVNRPATEQEMKNFREDEREITEKTEVPVVNKEARVVEEVKLKKQVDEKEETVRDNVRKTEVDVDEHHDDADEHHYHHEDVRHRGRSDDDYSDRKR